MTLQELDWKAWWVKFQDSTAFSVEINGYFYKMHFIASTSIVCAGINTSRGKVFRNYSLSNKQNVREGT